MGLGINHAVAFTEVQVSVKELRVALWSLRLPD